MRTKYIIIAAMLFMSGCTLKDIEERPGKCGLGMSNDEFGTENCQCTSALEEFGIEQDLTQCYKFIPENSTGTGCRPNHVCLFKCNDGFEQGKDAKNCLSTKPCDENEIRCNGSNIEVCDEHVWKIRENCEYGCEANACRKSCKDGAVQCNEKNNVSECVHGVWTEQMPCAHGCDNGICLTECDAGDVMCAADNVTKMLCTNDGWTKSEICGYWCENGKCLAECEEGSISCASDHRTKLLCSNGNWTEAEVCKSQCINGECNSGCTNGEFICDGNRVNKCINGEWQEEQTCKLGCSDGQCISGCSESDPPRCTEDGSSVLTCTDGSWQPQMQCGDGCTNGVCAPWIDVSSKSVTVLPGESTEVTIKYMEGGKSRSDVSLVIGSSNDICVEYSKNLVTQEDGVRLKLTSQGTGGCKAEIVIVDLSHTAKNQKLIFEVDGPKDDNHNGILDENETEADIGKSCSNDSDCSTGFCNGADRQCAKSCSDADGKDLNICMSGLSCRQDKRCAADAFVTEWDLSLGSKNTLVIPTILATNCHFSIDWGDGSATEKFDTCPIDNITHTYASNSTYQVSITGSLNNFRASVIDSDGDGNAQMLKRVISFGQVGLGATSFSHCTNLSTVSSIDIPDSTLLTDATELFKGASVFNDFRVGKWDMSQVTRVSGMFENALKFNQALTHWNMAKVIDMKNMFKGAEAFNGDVRTWDTSHVKYMSSMFQNARSFNHDISSWNTGKVQLMADMFNGASAFNQELGSWNLENVIDSAVNMFSNTGMSKDNWCSTVLPWKTGYNINIKELGLNYSCF